MLVLQNIKINIFRTMVLSEMIRFLKYGHPTLCRVLSKFHFTQSNNQPTLGPKNVLGSDNVMFLPPSLTVSQFLILESGWPISNHHLGLNLPNNYQFGSVGKPSPGWNGKSYFSFVINRKLSSGHFQIKKLSFKIRLSGCAKYLYLTSIKMESNFCNRLV